MTTDQSETRTDSTSVLQIVQNDILMPHGLVDDTWAELAEEQGEKIYMYRQYMDGKHRLDLTQQMADMLRIKKTDDERFSVNYARLVVNKKADRLIVSSIQAVQLSDAVPGDDVGDGTAGGGDEDTPSSTVAKKMTGQEWTDELLAINRFDALQIDEHTATIRDGDSYLLVDSASLKSSGDFPMMTHEPAYDGFDGVIAVFSQEKRKQLVAAVKIWEVFSVKTKTNSFRVNIYYDNRIERYDIDGNVHFVDSTGAIHDEQPTDWPFAWTENKLETGEALGVPMIPYQNQSDTVRNNGRSEMADAIPLNDILNRATMSVTATGELTGFPIKLAKGFVAPQNISPGTIISVTVGTTEKTNILTREKELVPIIGIPKEMEVALEQIKAADLKPLLDLANFAIDQIGAVTETPLPSKSDAVSGESLKQRESGLLGKVRVSQVQLGNSWEDAVKMCHKVQAAFGKDQPPEIKRWSTKWVPAAIRDDVAVVDNAMKVRDLIGDEHATRYIAPVLDFDAGVLAEIKKAKAMQRQTGVADILAANEARAGREAAGREDQAATVAGEPA